MTASPRDLALLLPALRQYRHNDRDGFVFGYDIAEADRIFSGLLEDRDQQRAMKAKARDQRDEAAVMLRELASATLAIISISDRKHDAWDAAKVVIAKVEGDASLEVSCETKNLLNWSEEHEANESIRYNHILADSPIGQFSIEWKGWKEHDAMCVYLDGDYIDSVNTLEDAKLIAEKCISDKANQIIEFCAKAKVEANTCSTCNDTSYEPRTDGEMHPQQTQETSRNESFAFRADGEANFYTVSERGGNWTARIQFNGEFMCDEQERMTAVITDALAAYRQQGDDA